MKYKPIEFNWFKDFINIIFTSLMCMCIPLNIFSLVMAESIFKTILHSILLMCLASTLTVKMFAWKIKHDHN